MGSLQFLLEEEEYGLGGDAKKLLKAAYRAPGQGNIHRLNLDQGSPIIQAGKFKEAGLAPRLALY